MGPAAAVLERSSGLGCFWSIWRSSRTSGTADRVGKNGRARCGNHRRSMQGCAPTVVARRRRTRQRLLHRFRAIMLREAHLATHDRCAP